MVIHSKEECTLGLTMKSNAHSDKDLTHQVEILTKQIVELELQNTTLKDTENYLNLFLHSTSDCIWNWNMVTNEVKRNIGFSRAFRYNSEEIQEGIDWWMERLHPDDRDRVLKIFENACAGGESTCGYE